MNPTIPPQMTAVQLVSHGGLDKLHYRGDVSTPVAGVGEVLLKVAAAGVNNTDINTRIGWYSKRDGDEIDDADAGWLGGPLEFPRIQGAARTPKDVEFPRDAAAYAADELPGPERRRLSPTAHKRAGASAGARSSSSTRPLQLWENRGRC